MLMALSPNKYDMIKIGIFGDSYAKKADMLIDRKSWVEYLAEDFDVTNYGEVGSNQAYSYDKFLQNHNRHHVNIFFVTSYGRLWVPQLQTITKGIAGMNTVLYNLNICTESLDTKILQAAHDYYMYLENEEQQKLMHTAMVKDLMTYTNTIIVPCFNVESLVPNWEGAYLADISDLDKNFYNIDYYTVDKRPCHLNDQNNRIFASKLKEYLLSNRIDQFYIDIQDYEYPVGESIDYNFFEKTDIKL
jgi:hypothetical protein